MGNTDVIPVHTQSHRLQQWRWRRQTNYRLQGISPDGSFSTDTGCRLVWRIQLPDGSIPESYKLLPLSGKGSISGYMEWTFLDESGNETSYPPFDVFIVRGAQTKSENTTLITPYLYFDLTEYYQKQYPQAGVRTVVVSYAIPMTYWNTVFKPMPSIWYIIQKKIAASV